MSNEKLEVLEEKYQRQTSLFHNKMKVQAPELYAKWLPAFNDDTWAGKAIEEHTEFCKHEGLSLWGASINGVSDGEFDRMRVSAAITYLLFNDEGIAGSFRSYTDRIKQLDDTIAWKFTTHPFVVSADIWQAYSMPSRKRKSEDRGSVDELDTLRKYVDRWLKNAVKRKSNKRSRKINAAKSGAIIWMPSTVTNITGKEHQFALSFVVNQTAHLQCLNLEADINSIEFDEETGCLYRKNSTYPDEVQLQSISSGKRISYVDLPFLRSILTAVLSNGISAQGNEVSLYYTALCKHFRMKATAENMNVIVGKIQKEFHDIIGVMPGRGKWQVINFSGFDEQTGIITFSIPYIRRIIADIAEAKERTIMAIDNKKPRPMLMESRLVKGSINSSRCGHEIKEMVFQIESLLMQAGTSSKPKNNPVHKSIADLIEQNPMMKSKMMKTKDGGKPDRNAQSVYLRRSFTYLYKLIDEHTLFNEYFKNFKIARVLPTHTTLATAVLKITHDGKNPAFKMPD